MKPCFCSATHQRQRQSDDCNGCNFGGGSLLPNKSQPSTHPLLMTKTNYFLLCFDFEKIQQDNRRFESPLLPSKFCSATHLISTSIEKEIQALCQTLRCQRQVEQIDFVVALSFQGNKNGEISSINAFDINHYKSS